MTENSYLVGMYASKLAGVTTASRNVPCVMVYKLLATPVSTEYALPESGSEMKVVILNSPLPPETVPGSVTIPNLTSIVLPAWASSSSTRFEIVIEFVI